LSRWRRRPTGIGARLLVFNALLVFMPAAGVLFLDTYERQLLADQERSMVEQGRVLAAALSGRGALRKEDVRHTLEQLRQRSGTRIRVVDGQGEVLADTSLLGPRRAADDEAAPEAPTSVFESWLYRMGSLPIRVVRKLRPPRPPHGSADVYARGGPLLGSEVQAALAGRYGAATRISSGGQRSVTLYSAIPVLDGEASVGAVLVSQSTYRILRALYLVRIDVFRVLLASLAAAVVLSLLLSRTIARPLVRLRNQAEALLDGRGRLHGRFHTPARRDEIGDLARSLEALRARLEAHIRGVEAFASDVSHEFKNPLASIRSASELLAEVEDPGERKRFAAVVEREVARMEHMLSAVSEIGHLDAQGDSEDRERLELRGLVEGLVEAQQLRGGGPVQVRGESAPVFVSASSVRLGRALENLLDNATSFSPEGCAVLVELAREGEDAVVRVLDRGPGIPDEHREKIFARFFSFRPHSEPRAGGLPHTGLGLSIARAVVENAGGRLVATNRADGGACFEVRIPLA